MDIIGKQILLVDDNISLVQGIGTFLSAQGFLVDTATNGQQAFTKILDKRKKGKEYDVVVLDRMMPVKTGDELLVSMRAESIFTPVIFLTAQDEPEQRIEGLELGADDYIVKPFSLNELLARVRVQLRKTDQNTKSISGINTFEYAGVTINRNQRTLACGEAKEHLTETECDIFFTLLIHHGEMVQKDTLLKLCSSEKSLDVHIFALRSKLKKVSEIIKINTIHGKGYEISH